MKTTALIIEWLVAGVLILLAVISLVFSLFPVETRELLAGFGRLSSLLTNEVVLATIVTAIAYAVGVLSEFAGWIAFEWWLDRIKMSRLPKYLRRNHAILKQSLLLAEYLATPPKALDLSTASALYGEMRFDVLMRSPRLYKEIESQINRFRLIRVLFLVELILFLAVVGQLLRGSLPMLMGTMVLIIVIGCVNVVAIGYRFHRYCRAIERSYKALLMAQRPEADTGIEED